MKKNLKLIIPIISCVLDILYMFILQKNYNSGLYYPEIIVYYYIPIVIMCVSHVLFFFKSNRQINGYDILFGLLLSYFYYKDFTEISKINKFFFFGPESLSNIISIAFVAIVTELVIGRKFKYEMNCIYIILLVIFIFSTIFLNKNAYTDIFTNGYEVVSLVGIATSHCFTGFGFALTRQISLLSLNFIKVISLASMFIVFYMSYFYTFDLFYLQKVNYEIISNLKLASAFFLCTFGYYLFDFLLIMHYNLEIFYLTKLIKFIALAIIFNLELKLFNK